MSDFFHASFDPVALSLGPVKIHWYGISYAAGIFLAWRYGLWLIRKGRSPIFEKDLNDYIPWAIVGIILGGRLGIAFLYNFDYYRHHLMEIFYIWRPGMAFHGGLLGVIITTAWFCHHRKISFLKFADLLATVTPIGLFFGRCANFINAELVGRPTTASWAVIFPSVDMAPRHPSQLYEAFLEGIMLFLILAYVASGTRILRQRPGTVSGFFLIGYGIARIVAEYFRQPDIQIGYLAGGTTMGQWLSVPLIIVGLGLLILSRKLNTKISTKSSPP